MGHCPEPRVASSDYVVVGVSQKTSSIDLRDQIFVEDAELPDVLAALRDRGFDEVMVVSTCDRVEFYGVAVDVERAVAAGRNLLELRMGKDVDTSSDAIFCLTGDAAARHVFAVAASLESLVVGEAEVLGQIKHAHAQAADVGAVGAALELLMQQAYGAAKDIRTNTGIAEGPVSMATAAIKAAGSLFGSLENISALLIGPSEIGLLMVDHFQNVGLRRITVAAGNASRSAALARIVGGHSVTYDDIPNALIGADLVIGAAGLGRYMVTAEMLRRALRARRRRPVFVLDVAIPGDADPDIAMLEDAFLYDLDTLETIAQINRDMRDAEMQEAWRLVDKHLEVFQTGCAEREAVPVVKELRAHFEAVRDEIRASAPHASAEEVSRRLINRLLHEPFAALREAARDAGSDNAIALAARRMFALKDVYGETQMRGKVDLEAPESEDK